jgi:integrase/recombinase XerD
MQKSLSELHNEFMNYAEFTRGVSPKTLRAYRASFALLTTRFPALTPSMLVPDTMTEYFKWLQTRSRVIGRQTRHGVKKSTIATYWRRLSKFFDWLKARRYIEANPLKSDLLEFPLVRYDDKQYLNRPDIEKILVAIQFNIAWKSHLLRARNLAIISLAFNCGLRRGELLGLKCSDVDLARNELTVRGATSKSRTERTIPLNTRAKRDLEDYLEKRREKRCTSEYLWVSEKLDTRLTEDGLKHAIKVMVRESGIKFHIHQCRHTFAVNFLHNSGHNSFKLQALLGHRSIVSSAIYTRCLPMEIVRADVERLSHLENTL